MNKDITMMDGEQVHVGDPVYCLCYGWGYVMSLWYGSAGLVAAKFGEKIYTYNRISFNPTTKDTTYVTRTLYWQKPAEIIPPPKPRPKKMIKVWDWFVEYADGGVERVQRSTEQWLYDGLANLKTTQKIDGTEREVEVAE